jgi:hypothetical protein
MCLLSPLPLPEYGIVTIFFRAFFLKVASSWDCHVNRAEAALLLLLLRLLTATATKNDVDGGSEGKSAFLSVKATWGV